MQPRRSSATSPHRRRSASTEPEFGFVNRLRSQVGSVEGGSRLLMSSSMPDLGGATFASLMKTYNQVTSDGWSRGQQVPFGVRAAVADEVLDVFSSPSHIVQAPPQEDTRNTLLDNDMFSQIKGVSAGAVRLDGLFSNQRVKNEEIRMRFIGCEAVRNSDIRRIAHEITVGIYTYSALPWLSLESTHDRGAARLSTLHPCYRDTLIGMVCLELDVALKSVGGTAHGGLFLDTRERDQFLHQVCQTQDWGPNGQKRLSDPWLVEDKNKNALNQIQAAYPSFRTSDQIFNNGDQVRNWRKDWERVWEGDATGADVSASLTRLVVHCGEKLYAELHTDWKVDVHLDDSNTIPYEARRLAQKGADLCRSLLPQVPIPTPAAGDWRPPTSMNRLEYLVHLLRIASALSSVLLAAKSAELRPINSNNTLTSGSTPTPRWIPYEPAVDLTSNTVFLGGGVSVAAVGASPILFFTEESFQNEQTFALAFRFTKFEKEKNNPIPETLFLYEIRALGLARNYAHCHADLHAKISPEEENKPSTNEVLQLLRTILPDGYSRRHAAGRCRIARDILLRNDVATELAADKDPTKLLVHEETPFHERLVLMNGDIYDGHWKFGRKHGKGKYRFASGATYEGQWEAGKMFGIGFFTTSDGRRNVVDHRKKKK